MVRHAKAMPSSQESGAADHASAVPGLLPPDGGVGVLRDWLNGSLAAAQNIAAWMEQSQQLNAQAVNTWNENLHAAMREAEQADDMPKLMGVTTQLLNRQMGTAIQQFGAGLKQTLETEAQWMERMRNTAVSASQRMLQTGVPVPSGEAGNSSPLAQLGQAQSEWLVMTQRWIDTVKSAQVPHA